MANQYNKWEHTRNIGTLNISMDWETIDIYILNLFTSPRTETSQVKSHLFI